MENCPILYNISRLADQDLGHFDNALRLKKTLIQLSSIKFKLLTIQFELCIKAVFIPRNSNTTSSYYSSQQKMK